MPTEYGYLINGKWIKSGKKREIKSPYNGEVAGVITIPERKKALEAVDAAQRAFEKFMSSPSYERSEILKKTARGIEERKEELAKVLVLEGGKPLKTARVEVMRAVTTFTVAAEEANRIPGGELVPIASLSE